MSFVTWGSLRRNRRARLPSSTPKLLSVLFYKRPYHWATPIPSNDNDTTFVLNYFGKQCLETKYRSSVWMLQKVSSSVSSCFVKLSKLWDSVISSQPFKHKSNQSQIMQPIPRPLRLSAPLYPTVFLIAKDMNSLGKLTEHAGGEYWSRLKGAGSPIPCCHMTFQVFSACYSSSVIYSF